MAEIDANDFGPGELLTLPKAARRAGLSVRQLRRARSLRELEVYQIGEWPRVRWVDVVRWIESKRVRPTDHARSRVEELLAREGTAQEEEAT